MTEQNLMTSPPLFHPELFEYRGGNPKSSYTVKDLWVYFNILQLGPNNPVSDLNSVTREYLDNQKRLAIESVPDPSPEDQMTLVHLCKSYGLETILVAMDHMTMDMEDVHMSQIYKFIGVAKAVINRRQLEERMGTD